MNNEIRLSILLACHAKTPWFAEMLDSLLNSGYHFRQAEILICDDASPAGGDGDTARDYAERHPGLITVVRNEQSLGHAGSLERLRGMARGDYLMPFDSDDIFLLFDLDGSMAYLDAHPEAAGIYGKKRLFNETGDQNESHGGEDSPFMALTLPPTVPNAIVLRSGDIREAGGFLPIYGPVWDVFLWLRLSLRKKLLFDDSYRLLYRIHSTQVSREFAERFSQVYGNLRDWLMERFPGLYEAVRNGSEIAVTPENRIPFIMFCGYVVQQEKMAVQRKLSIIDAALQVMPEDYAVRQFRGKILVEAGRFPEAMAEFFNLLTLFPDRKYIRLLAWNELRALCRHLRIDDSVFAAQHDRDCREFFTLTPEQQRLLDQAAAAAR